MLSKRADTVSNHLDLILVCASKVLSFTCFGNIDTNRDAEVRYSVGKLLSVNNCLGFEYIIFSYINVDK